MSYNLINNTPRSFMDVLTDRFIDIERYLDNVTRFLNLPLVLLCIFLNVIVVRTYVVTALPMMKLVLGILENPKPLVEEIFGHDQQPRSSSLQGVVSEAIAWWLIYLHELLVFIIVFNIAFNYMACFFIGPGFAPSMIPGGSLDIESAVDPHFNTTNSQRCSQPSLARWTQCTKCGLYRDSKTHHCSVCRKCVRNFDHHCTFVTCIGRNNYRYFILYMGYTWMGVLLGTLTAGILTVSIHDMMPYGKPLWASLPFSPKAQVQVHDLAPGDGNNLQHGSMIATTVPGSTSVPPQKQIAMVFILCVVVSILLGWLFLWHVWLVMQGTSTIDTYKFRKAERRNAKQAMSSYPHAHGLSSEAFSEDEDHGVGNSLPSAVQSARYHKNVEQVFGPFRSWVSLALPSLKALPDESQ